MNCFWESLAIAERILRELWRRRRSLVFWLVFPVLLLLLNGLIWGERANLALPQAMELAAPPTLVGASLFFSCLGGSVATIVAEREQHTLKRLFLSPIGGASYFLGIFFAHSCIGLGQTLAIYLVAAAFGARLDGSLLLGSLIILLSIAAYVGVGFILGTQLAKRIEDVNALVATFGVPLLILGGAFVPASLFPPQLLRLTEFNPVYHMNEALVSVWAEGESFVDITENLGFLAVFALAMVIAGWYSYQLLLAKERQL